MKKPAQAAPEKEKRAKRTPEEKAARKSEKATSRASADLAQDRAANKASQKKSLKSAAKQLQKELDKRMSEVVTRIRKETKAKLKDVVKEATRRLDIDTERMFEQALHTIVQHYDSVSTTPNAATETGAPATEAPTTPRRTRRPTAEVKEAAAAAPKRRGPKPGTPATGAKRGPKPRAKSAPEATDVTNSADSPSTGAASA